MKGISVMKGDKMAVCFVAWDRLDTTENPKLTL